MSTPILTLDERDQRYAKVRNLMKKNGLDAIIAVAISGGFQFEGSLRYFVGQHLKSYSYDEYVVFPIEGDPVLIMAYKYPSYLARGIWIDDVRAPQDPRDRAPMARQIVEALNQMRLAKGRIGIAGLIPAAIYDYVTKNLKEATFVDAAEMMLETRRVKSQQEIRLMEKSAELADLAFERAKEVIKPNVKDHEVVAAWEYVLRNGGAEKTFNLIRSDPVSTGLLGWPTIEKTVESGDVVGMEITPCYGGYWTQLVRAVSIGTPQKQWLDMYDVCVEAHKKGVSILRPGRKVSEVTNLIEDVVREAGYDPQIRCGHASIGLDLAEKALSPDDNTILQPGMVLVIHPNAFAKDYSMEKPACIVPGDTYVVTDDEPRRLNKSAQELVVL